MAYRMRLAKRMLFSKKGSLVGAVLAVTVGILVIHVNFVIFQGLYDAMVRDAKDYSIGDVQITDESSLITKSDLAIIGWFERIPSVEAVAPRLSGTGEINVTKNGELIEETRVPVVGVDPMRDMRASTVHKTVNEGSYVFARNSIVLGSNVASDLGGAVVGDSVKLMVVDRWGEENIRRFIVSGIADSPGGQGFDYSVVVHI